ncbi:amidohydrolase family protein [Rhodococcus sp. BP-316]|uniref:amidohydrolase family protein n=1 Tax=Rhodococcus sp. BP-316 TaxID=2739445 RepID=UPI001C9AF467|nr:amidohydrolase family protein [Rhodococcus sp. BP-316]MBY6683068.1 amidohydrolase family protein [Rhodococcus sp. BP-316]
MSEAIRAVVPASTMDRMWPFRDMLDNTSLPATATGMGAETGTISAGKSADFLVLFLVLDRDLTAIDSTDIYRTLVDRTVFAGRTVRRGRREAVRL